MVYWGELIWGECSKVGEYHEQAPNVHKKKDIPKPGGGGNSNY